MDGEPSNFNSDHLRSNSHLNPENSLSPDDGFGEYLVSDPEFYDGIRSWAPGNAATAISVSSQPDSSLFPNAPYLYESPPPASRRGAERARFNASINHVSTMPGLSLVCGPSALVFVYVPALIATAGSSKRHEHTPNREWNQPKSRPFGGDSGGMAAATSQLSTAES